MPTPTYQELLDDHLASLVQDLDARLANPSPGDRYWFELQAKRIGELAAFSGHAHVATRLGELRLRFVEIASEEPAAPIQQAVDLVRSDPVAVR
jgi:hypothetical protein